MKNTQYSFVDLGFNTHSVLITIPYGPGEIQQRMRSQRLSYSKFAAYLKEEKNKLEINITGTKMTGLLKSDSKDEKKYVYTYTPYINGDKSPRGGIHLSAGWLRGLRDRRRTTRKQASNQVISNLCQAP